MSVLWGVIVVSLSLLSWGGQAVSLLAPARAVRWLAHGGRRRR
jgi:hypothetical protein